MFGTNLGGKNLSFFIACFFFFFSLKNLKIMKELHKTPKTLVLLSNTPQFQWYKKKFTNNIGPQLKHIDNLMR